MKKEKTPRQEAIEAYKITAEMNKKLGFKPPIRELFIKGYLYGMDALNKNI